MKKILKSSLGRLTVLTGLSLILISVTNRYILTINFYDNTGDYLSGVPGQESAVYDSLQRYIYFSAIVYLLIKLLMIGLVIYTALYLSGHETGFADVFRITVDAEFIFLFADLIKVIWFKYQYPNGTLTDWRHLSMLSAMSFTGSVSPDWYYPMQTLNLFEIGYWFLLAFGIKRTTCLDYDQSLRIVLVSYVPALIIWVTIIAFCTVMVSPGNA